MSDAEWFGVQFGQFLSNPTRPDMFTIYGYAAAEDTSALTHEVYVVVAEGALVQIPLQVSGRNAMIDSADSVLCQRPESLNRVRVGIALNIDFLHVMDPLVFEPNFREGIIHTNSSV